MGRHTIFVMLALTFIWIILMEAVSWQIVATGMFISMLCMHFMGKFLSTDEIRNVNFYKLTLYPLWLLVRIYMDALFLARAVFSRNKKWGTSTLKYELKNEALRNILADSITLTPGSIFLDREGDDITLLCIGDKKTEGYTAIETVFRSVEKVLLRAQEATK